MKGKDRSAFCSSARARVPLGERARAAARAHEPGSFAELWVDFAASSGSDAQDVAAGHQVALGDVVFLGPTRVASALEVRQVVVSLAEVGRFESFAVSPSIGFAFLQRELVLDADGGSVSDGAHAVGLDLGLELEWRERARPFLARAGFHAGLAAGPDVGVEQRAFELDVGWSPDPHFLVRAGWRHWTWIESLEAGDSDVEYALSGLVLAIEARL